jgi:hypothetical protein
MSPLHWIITAIAVYIALAIMLDGPAHRLVYPLVGFGHPLTGRPRWLVRLFGPLILAGIALWRAPMVFVLVLVALSFGLGRRIR